MHKNEDGCCIYTDGWKLRGRVGCALVCILDKVEKFSDQKRLSDGASVYMAELKAIEAAIMSANSHHYSSVKIISDSRLVLQGLCNPNNCTAPISSLKSLLGSSTTSCELIWTKAHVGTEGNEISDLYAKEATTSSSPVCSCGKEIEDRDLLIFKCPTMVAYHWVVRRDMCLGSGRGFFCFAVAAPFIISRMPPWGAGRVTSRLPF
ncbi:hypothetical protein CDAR_410561 [Caerostris darwini]|uniref:RNase H type-1 domain-containing protein n=1 Tax=Caerostris darwini TaxID=1538125 RepID=A0AAV4N8E3_9ARAC|nr:hypothetical protein CDAR_410561 [Caerostris darwini]